MIDGWAVARRAIAGADLVLILARGLCGRVEAMARELRGNVAFVSSPW